MRSVRSRGRACWILVVVGLLATASAHAQVNAETLTERVTDAGWGGGGKSTFSFSSGNVDLLSVRGELAGYFATPHPDAPEGTARFWFRDRILAYGSAGLTRASGEEVANDGYGHLRYTRMQWMRFGAEFFVQAQYDQFRLLQRRLVAGLGTRTVFVNMEQVVGWFGTGTMAEFERRNIAKENRPPAGPDAVDVINHRWANYATIFATLAENLTFVNTLYVQPRWNLMRDVQVLEEARLAVKLRDHLELTADLSVRYDSRAPRTVEKLDLRTGSGLMFSF